MDKPSDQKPLSQPLAQEEGASAAINPTAPTPARAVVCLFLNVIVFPGLGTLLSGDRTRKRTGFVQLGFGAALVPVMIFVGIGMMSFQGVDPEVVKAWLSNFMMILVLWNLVTGVQIFRDAWKKARAEEVRRQVPGT
jgi:hypothetical protein